MSSLITLYAQHRYEGGTLSYVEFAAQHGGKPSVAPAFVSAAHSDPPPAPPMVIAPSTQRAVQVASILALDEFEKNLAKEDRIEDKQEGINPPNPRVHGRIGYEGTVYLINPRDNFYSNSDITMNQAKALGGALGGMKYVCPRLYDPNNNKGNVTIAGGSFRFLFKTMGIDKGFAMGLIATLKNKNLFERYKYLPYDAPKPVEVHAIFTKFTGITLPYDLTDLEIKKANA